MIKDYSNPVNKIRKILKAYLLENNLKSLVLGISGGMDSALVAVLAKPVCDELGVSLIGRSLPIETNENDENERAKLIGKSFCTDFKEVDLTSKFYVLKDIDDLDENVVNESEIKFHKVKFGNIKARIRMIYLYNLAYKNRGMVLSTDNWTEFLLGFSTIMGDWGDYGMIQQLWKTEVYNMAQWLCENELTDDNEKALYDCIVCTATDGLGITNSDLEQLLPSWIGNSRDGYKVVDEILLNYTSNLIGNLENPVISRYNRTHFKRNWPIIVKRNDVVLDSEQ